MRRNAEEGGLGRMVEEGVGEWKRKRRRIFFLCGGNRGFRCWRQPPGPRQPAPRRLLSLLDAVDVAGHEGLLNIAPICFSCYHIKIIRVGQMYSMLMQETVRIYAMNNMRYTVVSTAMLSDGPSSSQNLGLRSGPDYCDCFPCLS